MVMRSWGQPAIRLLVAGFALRDFEGSGTFLVFAFCGLLLFVFFNCLSKYFLQCPLV
jgi:hypothetical protein